MPESGFDNVIFQNTFNEICGKCGSVMKHIMEAAEYILPYLFTALPTIWIVALRHVQVWTQVTGGRTEELLQRTSF